jgi:hypothetical protein
MPPQAARTAGPAKGAKRTTRRDRSTPPQGPKPWPGGRRLPNLLGHEKVLVELGMAGCGETRTVGAGYEVVTAAEALLFMWPWPA